MKIRKSIHVIGCFILSCSFILGVVSCSRDQDVFSEEPPSLSIKTVDGEEAPTEVGVPAMGSSETYSITSNGLWEITKQGVSTDWVTLTPTESAMNGEITVVVARNMGQQARKLTLRFAVDGAQVNLMTISQLGFVPSISVLPKPEEPLTQESNDITFTVTTNDDTWNYTLESGIDWLIEKEKTATTLTLNVSENSRATPRTANITFSLQNYPVVSDVVTITQAGKELVGYVTKQYGEKVWMIENLSDAGADGHLGYAYTDPVKAAMYGRLYTWNEAMTGISKATNAQNPYTWNSSGVDDAGNPYVIDGTYANSYNMQIQGACPEGWHVPNMNDWYDLLVAIKQEYSIPGNTLSEVGSSKDGYIIGTQRNVGIVSPPVLTTWGIVAPYIKGSSPSNAGGLWEGTTTFNYGGNANFPAGAYPLFKDLSSEIGFNILPSGRRTAAGVFNEENRYSFHWVAYRNSATTENSLRVTVGFNNANFSNAYHNPLDAFCLRCVANY